MDCSSRYALQYFLGSHDLAQAVMVDAKQYALGQLLLLLLVEMIVNLLVIVTLLIIILTIDRMS